MTGSPLLEQVFDFANRADPYPLYTEMRKTPVALQTDGTYAVTTYDEIVSLLHDPRLSSDLSKRPGGSPLGTGKGGPPPAFINTDPPIHDRLRRLATRHFGPPNRPDLVSSTEPELMERVTGLIDAMGDGGEIDIVDEFAYPYPVSVICKVLGVPPEDEPRFHGWSQSLIDAISTRFAPEEERPGIIQRGGQALIDLRAYLDELAQKLGKQPAEDLLSGLVSDDGPDGRMSDEDIQATGQLLLVAGHETTVNLISNGMLTMLRQPELLERVAAEPGFVIRVVEELLRFQPPVQMMPNRSAASDIPIDGTTIPKGSAVTIVVASGNRDPARFRDPDRFDPDREDREHLGFGGGIHYCFGAPLARLEVQLALTELARRLQKPRLMEDPPPYRPSPILRGPRHLRIAVDGVAA
jgi:cytochrome P450